jgi:hypothetical protein
MFWQVFMRTLFFVAVALPLVAQAQPDLNLIPPDDAFREGISPSHVYARIDLLDRSLDALLEAQTIELKEAVFPKAVEQDLEPMHVYQAVLICTWRLQQLDDLPEVDIKPIPTISADPRVYYPRDVFFIVDLMLNNVRAIGAKIGVDMPADEMPSVDKTPTDVFNRAVRVFVKLNALCGYKDLEPSEVFAQMVRGVEDVKSMLRQADPAARYRIDKPSTEPNRTPGDVFEMCLSIRKQINLMRQAFDMETVPVPQMSVREGIRPFDVFFQTQIIIAELNLLKKPLKTKSNSPLPVPVTGKTPTRVHEQATMILHLLEQVKLPEPESSDE